MAAVRASSLVSPRNPGANAGTANVNGAPDIIPLQLGDEKTDSAFAGTSLLNAGK